jgi:uncharacterized protein with HEPN domain
MRREVLKLLEDARIACAEVDQFIERQTEESFLRQVAVQRSVERSLEITGEALRWLRDLDPEFAPRIPNLSRVISLRNILAHGYDVLDYEIIWNIATHEVPALRASIDRIMNEIEQI